MKRVLLISDLTSFGKCSLTVSIPIISSLGIETIPLPTMLLSNHTGFDSYILKDNTDTLLDFFNEFKKIDLNFDCVYTGFFKDAGQIDITKDIVKFYKDKGSMIFIDPILGENGELFKCFDEKYLESMKDLVNLADFISPNITEACLLTNSNINDNPIDTINKFNCKVVITSIRKDNQIGYLIKDEDINEIYYPYIDKKIHGTGDVFSSFMCGEMIKTNNFKESCIKAAEFTNKAIINTINNHPDDLYGVAFEDIL